MICPHCKKPVNTTLSEGDRSQIRKMVKDGYSMRDIAGIFTAEGKKLSAATVCRISKEKR